MATKEAPSLFNCLERALPDEPYFELIARDPAFGKLVRLWAEERRAAVLCGDRPLSDMEQVREAMATAAAGEKWRRDNLYAWRSDAPLVKANPAPSEQLADQDGALPAGATHGG